MKDKIEFAIKSRTKDGAGVIAEIQTGDAGMFILTVGLRGIVTEKESEEGGILLIDGNLPMTDQDWCDLVLNQQLGKILPYMVHQTS